MKRGGLGFFSMSLALLLGMASVCAGEELFSDSFDASPDWQSAESFSPVSNAAWPATWADNPNGATQPPPMGWTSYRAAIPRRDGHEKTFVLSSEGSRSPGGKGITYNIESSDYGSWTGGGLDVFIPDSTHQTLYVRLYLKYDPNTFHWGTVVPNFGLQKIGRISRFKSIPALNNSPQFFLSGTSGQSPTFYPDILNNPAYNTPPEINPIHFEGLHVVDPGAGDAIPTDVWNLPLPSDGQWHCYEFRVTMNSAGQADGEWEVWVDGSGASSHHHVKSGLRWVDTALSSLLPGWNWITIPDNSTIQPDPQYVNSIMKLFMDDVVISTHYSGPPAPPASVTAQGLTDSSIRVSFQPGSNGATFPTDGYRIYYGVDANSLNSMLTLPATATEAVITDLATGTYHFAVAAYNRGVSDLSDKESLRGTASALTVDTIAPAVTLAPVPSVTGVRERPVSGTVSDQGGVASVTVKVGALAAVAATVTGNSWSYTIPALAEGGNSIVVTARDLAGNEAAVVSSILLDTVPPAVVVNQIDSATIFTSLTVSGTVSDAGGVASVLVQVNGGVKNQAVVSGSGWSYQLTNLQPGSATELSVTAIDVAGNESGRGAAAAASIGVLQAGDLTGDVAVGVEDAQSAMQMAVGLYQPDAGQLQRGDLAPMSGGVPAPDGVINTGDAVVILGILTGLVTF